MSATTLRLLNQTRVACLLLSAACVGGCGPFLSLFPLGTYSADVPCTLTVGEGDAAETAPFETPISLQSLEFGNLLLNGVPVELGGEVTFSMPTADLTFEITDIRRGLNATWITFEPRPTLPGISIDGSMEQMFWNGSGDIHVSADAILDVTDISGTTRFGIACDGLLTRE